MGAFLLRGVPLSDMETWDNYQFSFASAVLEMEQDNDNRQNRI